MWTTQHHDGRLQLGAFLLLFVALASPALHSQLTTLSGRALDRPTYVAPSDNGIVYSEYVNSSVNDTWASFDRTVVNGLGNTHSPGTRISFASNATMVRVQLDYRATLGTPGAGIFRLEVDGQLQPGQIGSDTDQGVHWYPVVQQAIGGVRREYCLVFPYGSNVDFRGLELTGGSPGLLSPPPPPPSSLLVAYGDSITHGFDASSTVDGYPYQVAGLQGTSVLNMGFTGQVVTPADGTAVANLGGDCVIAAIGTNDYSALTPAAEFSTSYGSFLDNIRAVQPSVPIFVITPTWVNGEGVPNALGLTREDYRQLIRDVVFPRTSTDSQLHLIEGQVLVPSGLSYFPDGIHPNDAGFLLYATALGGDNLVTDQGFELDAFSWTDLGNTQVTTSDPFSGAQALQVGTGAGGRQQPVGRVRRDQDYLLSAWCKVGAAGEQGELGISFHDEFGVEVDKHEVQVTWTSYQQAMTVFCAPTQFAYALVSCSKAAGPSFLYVDDVELLEVGAASTQTYGVGNPGTFGVPSLSGSAPPVLGSTISINLGNSLGAPTLGGLFLSHQSLQALALGPAPSRHFPTTPGVGFTVVPAEGLQIPLGIPGSLLCGDRILLQGLQLDPDAAGGVSASRLLGLTLGH